MTRPKDDPNDWAMLQPCNNSNCECFRGECTHPGFYDARGEGVERARADRLQEELDTAVENLNKIVDRINALCESKDMGDNTPNYESVLVNVPAWIEQDITLGTVEDTATHGCSSGSYMPAVTYHQAIKTMAEHGDEVFKHIHEQFWFDNEVPGPGDAQTWGGVCCFYLSMAVELWCQHQVYLHEDGELEFKPQ